MFLYSFGETPKTFLNVQVKYSGSLYPTVLPIDVGTRAIVVLPYIRSNNSDSEVFGKS